jgi:hypothetical protein
MKKADKKGTKTPWELPCRFITAAIKVSRAVPYKNTPLRIISRRRRKSLILIG